MADLHNPHDTLFRALLSDPGRAGDFLRDHLPNTIAGQLAPAPPEILEGSFIDEALAGSQSDLLLKVALKAGTNAFVYVLAEHKSAPDPALPLQLASYMIRIWKRHAGTRAARLRALPPIIPVVVYHGAATWTVADSLRDMIATEDPDLAFLPGAGYILRNLRAMEIDALSRNAALKAGFITLRREALAFLTEIARSLPAGSDLRRQVLEYVLRVYNVDMDDLRALLRTGGHNELEALVGTIAETLLEQGEARGLAKGEARGLAKGKAEGKAETLRRQLERRFGPLPRDIEARVADAGPERIEDWLDAVLDAPDLATVFAQDRPH